jgi:hypothetical protein
MNWRCVLQFLSRFFISRARSAQRRGQPARSCLYYDHDNEASKLVSRFISLPIISSRCKAATSRSLPDCTICQCKVVTVGAGAGASPLPSPPSPPCAEAPDTGKGGVSVGNVAIPVVIAPRRCRHLLRVRDAWGPLPAVWAGAKASPPPPLS